MNPRMWWVCGRKTPYTERAARKAVKRAAERWRQHFRSYECPYCGQWHLTKNDHAV